MCLPCRGMMFFFKHFWVSQKWMGTLPRKIRMRFLPNEWIFRKSEKLWSDLLLKRDDLVSVEGEEELPDGATSYSPCDMSDTVGPSILAQFLDGARRFEKEVELL